MYYMIQLSDNKVVSIVSNYAVGKPTCRCVRLDTTPIMAVGDTLTDVDALASIACYRIWDLVDEVGIPTEGRSVIPYSINYSGIDLMQRLHPKVWRYHGLVVQIIYYRECIAGVYSIPVVRERWTWETDQYTKFSNKKSIAIEWYQKVLPGADEALMPAIKTYDKFYTTSADKISEIQRRRSNVINDMEETVIGFIAYTATAGDILAAITLGQALMVDTSVEMANFINQGTDGLSLQLEDVGIQTTHSWLTNDLDVVGLAGTSIAEFMVDELRVDTYAALQTFSFDNYPDS